MNEIIASIDRLLRLEPDGRRVLSAYLATDPSRGPGRNLKAHVNDVFQEVRSSATEDTEALEAELEGLRARIDELEERPRGLAIFSSASLGLSEMLPLRVTPQPGAWWARRLNLRPLLALLDEYEPTLVLLVDKERSRLFRVVLDEIEELEGVHDEIPPKHQQGGESQKNFQRHHDEHVLQHVRRAVDMLMRHAEADRLSRIAVGGPAEVLGHLRRFLPQSLEPKVAGTIAVPVAAPASEILEAARALRSEWERAEEMQLLTELDEQLGRARAIRGLSDVVEAAMEQRIRTLVYAAGTAVPGARCRNCGMLLADASATACPACGQPAEHVDDLLDLLASRVLQNGGTLEEVHGEAAGSLQSHGGIAALLLYPIPAERSG